MKDYARRVLKSSIRKQSRRKEEDEENTSLDAKVRKQVTVIKGGMVKHTRSLHPRHSHQQRSEWRD
jgi:hypothetical protein